MKIKNYTNSDPNVPQVFGFECPGCGIILKDEEESEFIDKIDVVVHGITISAGSMTTLDGMFKRSVRFAGLLKNEESIVMCFHVGIDNGKSYFQCFFLIDENMILNKYTHHTARNFVWKNGKWK